MFLGNFSFAFFDDKKIDRLYHQGNKAAKLLRDESKKTYSKLLIWFDNLFKEYENESLFEFIYRPHPSEYISKEIINLSKKYSKFHIIKEYSVGEWLNQCDLLFHWNSTSAVEAVFSNKTIFTVRPNDISPNLKMEMLEELPKITNYEIFKKTINDFRNNTYDFENLKIKLNYYYFNFKNKISSTDETTNFIYEILKSKGPGVFKSKYNFLNALKIYIKQTIKTWLLKTRLLSRIKKYRPQINDNLE